MRLHERGDLELNEPRAPPSRVREFCVSARATVPCEHLGSKLPTRLGRQTQSRSAPGAAGSTMLCDRLRIVSARSAVAAETATRSLICSGGIKRIEMVDRTNRKDIRDRRRWICSLGAGMVAAPLCSIAQHAGKLWPVGDSTNRGPTRNPTEASSSDPLPVFTPARDQTGAITNYASLPLNAWHQLDGSAMAQ